MQMIVLFCGTSSWFRSQIRTRPSAWWSWAWEWGPWGAQWQVLKASGGAGRTRGAVGGGQGVTQSDGGGNTQERGVLRPRMTGDFQRLCHWGQQLRLMMRWHQMMIGGSWGQTTCHWWHQLRRLMTRNRKWRNLESWWNDLRETRMTEAGIIPEMRLSESQVQGSRPVLHRLHLTAEWR